jgi:hypothetical protein
MEAEPLVDYIVEQMRVGHDEPTLREHLQHYGWSAGAIDAAFIKYHRLNTEGLKAVRAARRKARRKWTMFKRIKVGAVGVAVIATVLIGAYALVTKHTPQVQAAVKPLTYAQKQANDVNTVAGAVAQYAAATGSLPTMIAANQNDSVSICGTSCGADATPVTLQVYKPAGINFAPYSTGLTVSDQYSMYLVPGAKCASKTSIGMVNTKPRSIVILYAQAGANGLQQRCVVL